MNTIATMFCAALPLRPDGRRIFGQMRDRQCK